MDQQLTKLLRNSLWILIQTEVTKTPDSSLLYVFLTVLLLTMGVLKITCEPEFTKSCDFVALWNSSFHSTLFALLCEKVWHNHGLGVWLQSGWRKSEKLPEGDSTTWWSKAHPQELWNQVYWSSGTVEPSILILRNCGTRYSRPQELWNQEY